MLQCQRQRITSLDLQSRSTAQDMVVLLGRGGKLLTHAVFIVPQDPTSVPARLPLRALDHSPCYCICFFQSRCGTWHLPLLSSVRLQPACFSSILRSIEVALLPPTVNVTLGWHLPQTCSKHHPVFKYSKLNLPQYQLSHQVDTA